MVVSELPSVDSVLVVKLCTQEQALGPVTCSCFRISRFVSKSPVMYFSKVAWASCFCWGEVFFAPTWYLRLVSKELTSPRSRPKLLPEASSLSCAAPGSSFTAVTAGLFGRFGEDLAATFLAIAFLAAAFFTAALGVALPCFLGAMLAK